MLGQLGHLLYTEISFLKSFRMANGQQSTLLMLLLVKVGMLDNVEAAPAASDDSRK